MLIALLLILAILPGLMVCYFIFQADKYEKEDKKDLAIAFGLGALSTLPAWQLESWMHQLGLDETTHIGKTLFFSFIVVGLGEELFKLAFLLPFAFWKRFFNEPMDAIVYAVMVAMGFATVENLLYAGRMDVPTMVVRAFTAVPAHAAFAVITGYFIGFSYLRQEVRWQLIARGLAIAAVLHGTYDFFILIESYEWLGGLALVALALSIYYSRRLIQLHQEGSPFKPGGKAASHPENTSTPASTEPIP
jgi:RsiW-degrading membrane proteinase PrsW (M82 family)